MGMKNVLHGMGHGTYGIIWSWQECTEEDGIAPHGKKKCGQNDQDISQAQAGAHSRLYVGSRTLLQIYIRILTQWWRPGNRERRVYIKYQTVILNHYHFQSRNFRL